VTVALTARTLFTPLERIEQAVVLIEDGVASQVGTRNSLQVPLQASIHDFGDCILAPGMLDIHVHGASGYDVMQADEGGRSRFEQFLARHGVTSYYPTTVAAPLDETRSALERLACAIESAPSNAAAGCARPLGIHLEGPFLSHPRRGVHPPEYLVAPTLNAFDKLWQAAKGRISLMTIAPELDGAPEVIAEATRRGVCVSMGHSDADLKFAKAAGDQGARHATHVFNAMRPLNHRSPGLLAEILTNPKITADVIADGVHVDPSIVKLVLRAKGIENTVLITDAISATGMPDGRYRLGSFEVELKDGKCLADGKLAGSVLTMDRALRNLMEYAGLDLQPALRAATMNPAAVAGAENKGTIRPGADADFVVLTQAGEVRATVVRGVVVQ
jgi:N-acetylglucosamine-6-phosphate deacetylase